ncbi:MAG: MFS transporter [Ruminococcaceae bacterium]|nr:MFS transporter [Oscillospiraceae bacterium]
MKDFNSIEYKRSRNAYMAQCTVEYFVSLLVTDAFLAKLLSSIGISDMIIGIISSFITLAFVIQLMSIFLVKVKVSTKKLVIFFDTISIFFFMFLYVVPFIPIDKTQKTILIVVSIIAAYAGKYLIHSICFKWANSFVDPNHRAEYSAVKEMISLFSGMIFTLITGYIIDRYEDVGNLNGGFLFIAAFILILNISNFVCLCMIKKEEQMEDSTIPMREVLKNTISDKNFRNIIILTVLWDVARYFTVGFIGVFKTKDLMMSVLFVQVVNIIANFARMIISKPFGRYSDKHSFAKGFRMALCIAAIGFFINMFTTNKTWIFVVIYTILYNCSVAGTNQNSFNITYSYVDEKYITQAMAIKNCIGGIFGFAASLVAGSILDVIQKNGNQIFGIHIYAQQLFSGISFVITFVAIVFLKKVIEKQKVVIR